MVSGLCFSMALASQEDVTDVVTMELQRKNISTKEITIRFYCKLLKDNSKHVFSVPTLQEESNVAVAQTDTELWLAPISRDECDMIDGGISMRDGVLEMIHCTDEKLRELDWLSTKALLHQTAKGRDVKAESLTLADGRYVALWEI